ncbi:TPA: prepilin-type N-terminal cleavage/methylation domain-containing protein [Vibrio vulnificus]|uniref:pilin n=1 Tax=Vibrio vulnificus TaxID=672 RepID=UPI0005F127A7|nr:pilin [Vibrio vulnificus]EGR0669947.1 pilin [Vibrio vulnificus]EGR0749452.1 pilin [Vibrio vulnificus]EHI9240110.1 pilin [Vibrio vulnificus]EHU9447673.1 pilin [Vibrio vulnificus]ELA4931453.1 pilin [Vibrio vulnificus]
MKKLHKTKKQQGFTLIELMIVVAVIGVLAAIAIPQYQKYVAKAEVASALATLTGLKTNVEAYAVENGAFPDGTTSGQSVTDLGAPTTIPSGSVTFTAGANGAGSITFEFGATGVSNLITSKKFLLARDSSGTWTCDGTAATPVTDDLLPKNCK